MGDLVPGTPGNPLAGALAHNSMNLGNETYGINAGNDNPLSFTLNATVDGTTTSYDIPWSNGYRLRGIDLSTDNVGF